MTETHTGECTHMRTSTYNTQLNGHSSTDPRRAGVKNHSAILSHTYFVFRGYFKFSVGAQCTRMLLSVFVCALGCTVGSWMGKWSQTYVVSQDCHFFFMAAVYIFDFLDFFYHKLYQCFTETTTGTLKLTLWSFGDLYRWFKHFSDKVGEGYITHCFIY